MAEQLLHQIAGSWAHMFLTFEPEDPEVRCLPSVCSSFLQKWMSDFDDDCWEWKWLSKSTVQKKYGLKISGGSKVIHLYGMFELTTPKLEAHAKAFLPNYELVALPPKLRIDSIRIRGK